MKVHTLGVWTVRTYLFTGRLAVPQIEIGRIVPPLFMVYIGEIIRQELLRQERSVSWFARKLYCDRTNVYKIFRKQSLDTELLLRISLILHHDFFQYYSSSLESERSVAD